MEQEKFKELMSQDNSSDFSADNVFEGLMIIRKYCPGKSFEGAGHDVIYSVDISDLINAGITEEDVIKLRNLNWMLQDGEYLACFV